jgi:hypothetical protein
MRAMLQTLRLVRSHAVLCLRQESSSGMELWGPVHILHTRALRLFRPSMYWSTADLASGAEAACVLSPGPPAAAPFLAPEREATRTQLA